jgi:hypothetical protein
MHTYKMHTHKIYTLRYTPMRYIPTKCKPMRYTSMRFTLMRYALMRSGDIGKERRRGGEGGSCDHTAYSRDRAARNVGSLEMALTILGIT